MKKMVIFGAGSRGIAFKNSFIKCPLLFNSQEYELLFCDNDTKKHNTRIDGILCLEPVECLSGLDFKKDVIVIANHAVSEIFFRQLESFLFSNIFFLDHENYLRKLNTDFIYRNLRDYDGITTYDKFKDIAITIKNSIEEDEYVQNFRYELFTEQFISDIKQAKLFVDVGGELGFFTGLANKYMDLSQGEIHIFEPHPTSIHVLKELYGFNTKIKFHEKAVSNTSGFTTLYSSSETSSHTMDKYLNGSHHQINLKNGGNLHEFQSETIVLDEMFENLIIDVIKMDIEGAEVLAFEGMQKILEKRITKIYLEIHHSLGNAIKPNGIKYIQYLLNKYKYDCYMCVGNNMYKTDIYKCIRPYLVPRN